MPAKNCKKCEQKWKLGVASGWPVYRRPLSSFFFFLRGGGVVVSVCAQATSDNYWIKVKRNYKVSVFAYLSRNKGTHDARHFFVLIRFARFFGMQVWLTLFCQVQFLYSWSRIGASKGGNQSWSVANVIWATTAKVSYRWRATTYPDLGRPAPIWKIVCDLLGKQ